jgi:hypothetical protein
MVLALYLAISVYRRVRVIDARKDLVYMRTVTRDDVNTPYGRCSDCECKTRSHLLEPAEYEIYMGEEITRDADIFAANGWEEVEEVEKYEMVIEPKVMCHKCWVVKQTQFSSLVKNRYDRWMKETISHAPEIKRAVNTQVAYDFKDSKTISALKNLARQLKEAALDG